jgi:hypothetical protein
MNTTTKPTSQAAGMFLRAIKDAENLLAHFDTLNTKPPPPDIEVLKRAGLILAMTAWETYVEDRVNEVTATRLAEVADKTIAEFVRSRLDDEIKRLHNPNAEKTLQLFSDYAGIDLSSAWAWNNFQHKKVRERLNGLLKLRGDIVHRASVVKAGQPVAQPVTKEELRKAISFLRDLVGATESALARKAK